MSSDAKDLVWSLYWDNAVVHKVTDICYYEIVTTVINSFVAEIGIICSYEYSHNQD